MRAACIVMLSGLAALLAPRPAQACSCAIDPPLVLPIDGEIDVPLNGAIFIRVPQYTGGVATPELHDPSGAEVPLTTVFEGSWFTIYRAAAPLAPMTQYSLWVSSFDFDLNTVFTTGTAADEEPPVFQGIAELTADGYERSEDFECVHFGGCFGAGTHHRVRIRNPLPSLGAVMMYAVFTSPDGDIPETGVGLLASGAHELEDAACNAFTVPQFSSDRELCVALTAFDRAGNASPPLTACTTTRSCGGVDPSTCQASDECIPGGAAAAGCGCSTSRRPDSHGGLLLFVLLLVPLARYVPLTARRRA